MEQANYNPEIPANKHNVIGLEKGKLPPQAVDLEQAVLGAMMIDKKGLDEVIDILTPQVFYRPEHQAIYAVIQKLFNDSEPIDLLTVSNVFDSINAKSFFFCARGILCSCYSRKIYSSSFN